MKFFLLHFFTLTMVQNALAESHLPTFLELKNNFSNAFVPQIDELINHKTWNCKGKSIKSAQQKISTAIELTINFDLATENNVKSHEVMGYFSITSKNNSVFSELKSFELPLKFEPTQLGGLKQSSHYYLESQKIPFLYAINLRKTDPIKNDRDKLYAEIKIFSKTSNESLLDLVVSDVNAYLECE